MHSTKSEFPFFVDTPVRDLSIEERETVRKLLEGATPAFSEQLDKLRVVGRCGCGRCPTIFFERYEPGDREQDLSSYAGRDVEGGLVSVVLMQKHGRLSQLEFFSVDGHDPWFPPLAKDLGPQV